MIVKDQGVVLRFFPFGNTSRVVIWLTMDHGKLATMVKGSQREKSPFLGQYDLFYTCELLFYAREQRQLHLLKECTPLEWRPSLRTDWRACAAASYAASVLNRVMPVGPAGPEWFHLLDGTLDALSTHTPGPAFLPRFELRLLKQLGLAPNWTTCGKCRRPLPASATSTTVFDVPAGQLLCTDCDHRSRANDVAKRHLLSATALRILQAIDAASPLPPCIPAAAYREIRDIMGHCLEHHADLASYARLPALEILESPT